MSENNFPSSFSNAQFYFNESLDNPQQKTTSPDTQLSIKLIPSYPLIEEKQFLLLKLRHRAQYSRTKRLGTKVDGVGKNTLKKRQKKR
jgi:hypothetical protein